MNPAIWADIGIGVKAVGTLGILGGGIRWSTKVLAQFVRIADDVETIKTNHIPHLEAGVENLTKGFGEFKDAFQAHLLEVAKKNSE